MNESLTYRVEEAARALGISRGTAYELIRTGQMRHVRVGRRVLIPKAAVREVLGLAPEENAPVERQSKLEDETEEMTYVVTIRRLRK